MRALRIPQRTDRENPRRAFARDIQVTALTASQNRCAEAAVHDVIAAVPLLRQEWYERASGRLDCLTKPSGSLGRLAEIGARIVAIRVALRPDCSKEVVLPLVADHRDTGGRRRGDSQAVTRRAVPNHHHG